MNGKIVCNILLSLVLIGCDCCDNNINTIDTTTQTNSFKIIKIDVKHYHYSHLIDNDQDIYQTIILLEDTNKNRISYCDGELSDRIAKNCIVGDMIVVEHPINNFSHLYFANIINK